MLVASRLAKEPNSNGRAVMSGDCARANLVRGNCIWSCVVVDVSCVVCLKVSMKKREGGGGKSYMR